MLNTDQTNCYNESGQNVPCADSDQDGVTNRSHGVKKARFEVCGGIVIDHSTNLRWNHNASPTTFPLSWAEAFEYTAQLNRSRHHGIDDWRMPSRRELFSLISHQHTIRPYRRATLAPMFFPAITGQLQSADDWLIRPGIFIWVAGASTVV